MITSRFQGACSQKQERQEKHSYRAVASAGQVLSLKCLEVCLDGWGSRGRAHPSIGFPRRIRKFLSLLEFSGKYLLVFC